MYVRVCVCACVRVCVWESLPVLAFIQLETLKLVDVGLGRGRREVVNSERSEGGGRAGEEDDAGDQKGDGLVGSMHALSHLIRSEAKTREACTVHGFDRECIYCYFITVAPSHRISRLKELDIRKNDISSEWSRRATYMYPAFCLFAPLSICFGPLLNPLCQCAQHRP